MGFSCSFQPIDGVSPWVSGRRRRRETSRTKCVRITMPIANDSLASPSARLQMRAHRGTGTAPAECKCVRIAMPIANDSLASPSARLQMRAHRSTGAAPAECKCVRIAMPIANDSLARPSVRLQMRAHRGTGAAPAECKCVRIAEPAPPRRRHPFVWTRRSMPGTARRLADTTRPRRFVFGFARCPTLNAGYSTLNAPAQCSRVTRQPTAATTSTRSGSMILTSFSPAKNVVMRIFNSGVLQTTRFGPNLFSLTQLRSAKLW